MNPLSIPEIKEYILSMCDFQIFSSSFLYYFVIPSS